MTAIYAVTDGVSPAQAADINQYGTLLNNQFGLNDTAQPGLGRLVLPYVTADPGAPSNGQMWWRSDLGTDGRLMTYKNGKTIPHLGLRQRVEAALSTSTFTTSSTSYVDVTNATVDITTTGGRLRAYVIPDRGVSPASVLVAGTTAAVQPAAQLKVLRGATSIGEHYFWGGSAPAGQTPAGNGPLGGILADGDAPVAGLYTVKVQGLVSLSSQVLYVSRCLLVVEEWDP